MLATLTLPGTFFFYSGVAFVGATVLYFVLPETEGRSLIEIEEHFSGGVALNAKPSQLNDEEKRSDVTTVVSPTVTVRPKTDIVIGIPSVDQIFHKKENLQNQPHHHHNHHQLYVQNPRPYMRHNNRTNTGGEDINLTVFSTHL